MSCQPCGCDDTHKPPYLCEHHAAEKLAAAQKSYEDVVGMMIPSRGTSIPVEIRTVDPTTGGEKGSKLARFSLIPPDFLWALAEHYGRGARKYEDRNWERGYKWSLSVDALHRHLSAWLSGEDNDAETGSSHLVAVAWHAIALWWWHKRGKGTDDTGRTS